MSKRTLYIAGLIFLFATSWIAVAKRWFTTYRGLDTVYHFLGGLLIALLIVSYYSSEFGKLSQSRTNSTDQQSDQENDKHEVSSSREFVRDQPRSSKVFVFFTIVALTMAVGVFWEMYEYILNQTVASHLSIKLGFKTDLMGDLADTMKDLLMDSLGGITAALLKIDRTKKN